VPRQFFTRHWQVAIVLAPPLLMVQREIEGTPPKVGKTASANWILC